MFGPETEDPGAALCQMIIWNLIDWNFARLAHGTCHGWLHPTTYCVMPDAISVYMRRWLMQGVYMKVSAHGFADEACQLGMCSEYDNVTLRLLVYWFHDDMHLRKWNVWKYLFGWLLLSFLMWIQVLRQQLYIGHSPAYLHSFGDISFAAILVANGWAMQSDARGYGKYSMLLLKQLQRVSM